MDRRRLLAIILLVISLLMIISVPIWLFTPLNTLLGGQVDLVGGQEPLGDRREVVAVPADDALAVGDRDVAETRLEEELRDRDARRTGAGDHGAQVAEGAPAEPRRVLQGGQGDDYVSGDLGDDVMRGGQGDDQLFGRDGNDFLSGDLGDNTLTGGAGADTFHSSAGAGVDLVTDFTLAEGYRVMLDPGTHYAVSQVGADVHIDITGGGEVILSHVQLSSLTGDWIVA